MTSERSPVLPDATIRAAITMDAPDGAAERLWFDLSDRLDATKQRRRRFLVIPSPSMRVAFAVIAVIAMMSSAVYFLGPAQGIGVPPRPAQPTTIPTATPEPSSAQVP